MPPPQLHSRDYYIRVTQSELGSIVFEHLATAQDPAVALDAAASACCGHLAGFTEWQATIGNIVVSLAWDWALLADGDIRPVKRVAPRTNLKIVDSRGYDLDEASCAALFWQAIEGFNWRESVRQATVIETSLPRRLAS